MLKQQSLEDLIRGRITLGKQSPSGWYSCKCPVCNDYKERAAFLFEGGTVVWHDFNCGAAFKFTEGSTDISKNAKRVLNGYGISESELDGVVGSNFFNQQNAPQKEISLDALQKKVILATPSVELPPLCFPLGDERAKHIQQPLIDYLTSRCIDFKELKIMFSLNEKWLNRVIIPVYRNDKIIFWQARAIHKDTQPRYKSPGTTKDAVIWGYDNLDKHYQFPLFITEGIFDASSVNGVALLGSTLNDSKIEVLTRSRRQKVFVIDRNKNGHKLADSALQQGWKITFVDAKADDINDSIRKFGKLYTVWSLMKNMSVASKLTSSDNIPLSSKLALNMEMALAKMKDKRK